MSDLISREALLKVIRDDRLTNASDAIYFITNAPAIEQGEAVYQEYNPLISYWMDCDKDTYDKATERRVLHTTPQQPQSVADALEEVAKICDANLMSWADDDWNGAAKDCAKRIRAIIKRNAEEGE